MEEDLWIFFIWTAGANTITRVTAAQEVHSFKDIKNHVQKNLGWNKIQMSKFQNIYINIGY